MLNTLSLSSFTYCELQIYYNMRHNYSEQPPQPPLIAEELLKKFGELEASHDHLRQYMSILMVSSPLQLLLSLSGGVVDAPLEKGSASSRSLSPLREESKSRDEYSGDFRGDSFIGLSAVSLTKRQCLNILESIGQAVHITDLNCRLVYWNRAAADLYGYSAAEALGQNGIVLLADARNFGTANNIVYKLKKGESWNGPFLVKNKRRASQVSNKVKSKTRPGANITDHEGDDEDSHQYGQGLSKAALSDLRENAISSRANTHIGDIRLCFGASFHASYDEPSPGKSRINEIGSSKKEAWVGKKGIRWPWRGNKQDGSVVNHARLIWPWLRSDKENELGRQRRSSDSSQQEDHDDDTNRRINDEVPGSWSSSFNVSSTRNSNRCGSTSSISANKVDMKSRQRT